MRLIARAFGLKASQLLPDDDVALREDDVGIGLVQELEKIPDGERAAVLRMARELVQVVRRTATQWSKGALDGAPEDVAAMAELWNSLDDPRRQRAIRTLRASLGD